MRVFHQKSSVKAKEYYSASDYYASGPEQLQGQWFGKGAELLGLTGSVDQTKFDRLCDNLHPFENKRLTQINQANRRVLSDITFSAPKSVSILYATTEDKDILGAVQQAANATIGDLEKDALTRVYHRGGPQTLEETSNLVGASWLHLTTRPIDDPDFGPHPDPQLHVHAAVINATHVADGRWTAVDLSSVVRDSSYYEALFQSRLATNLKSLGIDVERSQHNFEVRGVERSTIEKFSRRKAEIDRLVDQGVAEKIAAKEGISLADAKDMLGAKSRSMKNDLYEIAELPSVWQQRLTEDERSRLDSIAAIQEPVKVPVITKEAAVDFATEHRFQNESVTRERHLIRDAMKRSIGDVAAEEIVNEVAKRDWIREGEGARALLSTQEVLAEEQAVLAFARKGRGSGSSLAPSHEIQRDWLSEEQKEAVKGLLKSTDRLQILRGVAGVGKTTCMSEAIGGIENAGTNVTVLAPGVQAAHEVLAEEGFEANTLASFLLDKESQNAARGSVIWIDEAGQAGMQDISKLIRVAEDIDARIVLSGDRRQHKSVARGAPLRLLESEAGIVPHEITKIRRQQGEYQERYRKAVSHLSNGEALEGFNLLDDLGFVHEMQDGERYRQLACDYANNAEAGKKTLVIAPTHAERAIVTKAIRDELKNRGLIEAEDHNVDVLKSKHLSDAQRGDSFNYQENDVIEFVRRAKGGFKAGERMRVVGVQDGRVLAESANGLMEVPIDQAKSFDVYRWHESNLAAGDTLRITKRNRHLNLYNGTMVTLEGFDSAGNLQLSNGKTISPDWGHIDNGITITSHASQGKTFQRVLVSQSSMSFPASTPEQIYVTASRGVERVDVYTDDVTGLRHAIERSRSDRMASELKQDKQTEPSRLAARAAELRLQASQFAQKQLQRLQELVRPDPQYAR